MNYVLSYIILYNVLRHVKCNITKFFHNFFSHLVHVQNIKSVILAYLFLFKLLVNTIFNDLQATSYHHGYILIKGKIIYYFS